MNIYVQEADQLRGKLELDLTALADKRLSEFGGYFRYKYPTVELRIIFGMGTEHVDINGVGIDPDDIGDGMGEEIRGMLEDVRRICGDYMDAAPNDIIVTGVNRS